MKAIQEDLTQYFGTKVKVQPDKKEHGGRIVIEYYNEGDLERVMELLKKKDLLCKKKENRLRCR